MSRKLLLCLGNPGVFYERTRHNIGWMFADYAKRQLAFPDFKEQHKFRAFVTMAPYGDHDLIIAKPVTFMNDSGIAAMRLCGHFRLDPRQDMIVVLDDLDMVVGNFKITPKPARTHNGMASIREHLGTPGLRVVRIGVDDRAGSRQIPSLRYVLMNFPLSQLNAYQDVIFPEILERLRPWL